MPNQIEHFHDGPEGVRRKLNEIVDAVNAFLQMRGDDNIQVQVQPGSGALITFIGTLNSSNVGGSTKAATGNPQKKGMVQQAITDNSVGYDYLRVVKTY